MISAGVFPPGTEATGVSDIRVDMTNAGFRVLDDSVVYDKEQRLITSPDPKALKEFCEEIVRRLPEVKEKKITNTPITKPDVEHFIREWFGKLDVHPPVDDMLSFLADEKFVMKMPEKTYCRHKGFKEWYKGVEKFVDQVHTIRGLHIKPVQDTAKVEIIVQWQASDSSAIGADRGKNGYYAAQTWALERSLQTQRLVIVRYNIDYFIPMVTDADLPSKEANVNSARKGREMYEKYFGDEFKGECIGLREFTINHLFAHIYSRSDEPIDTTQQISLRERCMITVSLLAAQGRKDQLEKHMKAALNLGISRDQMLEIAIHVAHYAGWATGNFVQDIALEVYEKTAERELIELN